jgi:hypothetical protein
MRGDLLRGCTRRSFVGNDMVMSIQGHGAGRRAVIINRGLNGIGGRGRQLHDSIPQIHIRVSIQDIRHYNSEGRDRGTNVTASPGGIPRVGEGVGAVEADLRK